jgi:molybdenum cofactor cytidylyltransferase
VGIAAARGLSRGAKNVLAIVRPGDHEFKELLRSEGVRWAICDRPHLGISESLKAGIYAAPDADGWLIGLADMPWITPQTTRTIVEMLKRGADIVAPVHEGRRGHPVGFARTFKARLLALTGDHGARDLLDTYISRLETFECSDPGVLRDIDEPKDITVGSFHAPAFRPSV